MTVGAVVVTYQRPGVLVETLKGVVGQTSPPEWIVVVDNDSDGDLRRRLEEVFPTVEYLPLADNPGYGAGLASGMKTLRERYDPDWYWLLDDDTPPSPTDLDDALNLTAGETNPWVVANRGGHLSWGRVRHDLHEVDTPKRADFTLVDGAIIAKIAVDTVGFPRDDLFMMCEDLDYTTRISDAGGVLLVRPTTVRAMYLGAASPWRAYYQARNHLRLALDRRSLAWVWGWFYRMLAFTLTDLARGRRAALHLRWRGALDGARNRMGRTI